MTLFILFQLQLFQLRVGCILCPFEVPHRHASVVLYFHFLGLQGAPGSPCAFPAPTLESAVSPRSPAPLTGDGVRAHGLRAGVPVAPGASSLLDPLS